MVQVNKLLALGMPCKFPSVFYDWSLTRSIISLTRQKLRHLYQQCTEQFLHNPLSDKRILVLNQMSTKNSWWFRLNGSSLFEFYF